MGDFDLTAIIILAETNFDQALAQMVGIPLKAILPAIRTILRQKENRLEGSRLYVAWCAHHREALLYPESGSDVDQFFKENDNDQNNNKS